jgi:hypothetical protein
MRINRSSDCGNSPKNQFAEDAAIAIMTDDRAALAKIMVEGRTPLLVGSPRRTVTDLLVAASGKSAAQAISIKTVVTHGRAGAVEGTIDHHGGTARHFCLVLRFASAKADGVSEARLYAP